MSRSDATNAAAAQTDRIAISFQELLTVIARIRAGRENAATSESFRAQIVQALETAGRHAQRKGYTAEQIRLTGFAVIAHLDEAVLKSANPVFADWARAPLRDELFHGSVAGETFYLYVRQLLMGDDSPQTADVLEVFQLCLLLGYCGRYGEDREGDRQAVSNRIRERIERIRGKSLALAPSALPEMRPAAPESDTVSRRLLQAAVAAAALLLLILIGSRLTLASALSALGLMLPVGW